MSEPAPGKPPPTALLSQPLGSWQDLDTTSPGVAVTAGTVGLLPSVPGYEIECVLGRGGMGVVYRARHTALERTVALKMILAGPYASPDELARFRSEARAVAQLQHPHIVQVFEVGEIEGRSFLALEFVAGGNLAQHLAGTPQPARKAAELVQTLACAMAHAHANGIIHRDLKPANILLSTRGHASFPGPGSEKDACPLVEPKITDFGLAKQLDSGSSQTQTGAIMGTPSYMAPEQATGQTQRAGPATDVYALGAILDEALTGRPPFRGETVLETLEQVRSQEPVPPRLLQPKAPDDLQTICLKCLQKDPHRRYASAQDLADDLGRFLTGEPIPARPVGRADQTLVDLLKYHLCVGEARRLVLEQLSRHYGRPFADQWDFVRFAEERQLGLDLLGPPPRSVLEKAALDKVP
jgi:serine/threonine protein kinase